MPRRNENARSRFRPIHDIWRTFELRKMSEMIDKKMVRRAPESLSEQIVRDFRKNEGLELYKALNPLKPISPISRIRPYPKIHWWNKVNWIIGFSWMCLILVVLAILIVSGLILFSPFSLRQWIR